MFWILKAIKRKIRSCMRNAKVRALFKYDYERFAACSGSYGRDDEYVAQERIIMAYHVLEKGLTMPRRRLGFGRKAVKSLMKLVEAYENKYGKDNLQVQHAISCITAYWDLHQNAGYDMHESASFWGEVKDFCSSHSSVPKAQMLEKTKEQLFECNEKPFSVFAASRHTVRHFCGEVSDDVIRSVVKLAMTAPSACNRQYVRVHCVSDHAVRDQILSLQNGNRGFGSDADKLLIVTSDLRGLRWDEERNDIYVNAGAFLMNLVYSLHYFKLGSCILNWSVSPEMDLKARRIVGLPCAETIIAIVACGQVPPKIQIAASPRKKVEDILVL